MRLLFTHFTTVRFSALVLSTDRCSSFVAALLSRVSSGIIGCCRTSCPQRCYTLSKLSKPIGVFISSVQWCLETVKPMTEVFYFYRQLKSRVIHAHLISYHSIQFFCFHLIFYEVWLLICSRARKCLTMKKTRL